MSDRKPIRWYRTPVDRHALRQLNRSDDRAGGLQAGGHFLLLIATGTLALLSSLTGNGWLVVASLLLHGTVHGFLHAAVHELAHARVFTSPRLNHFLYRVCCFVTWYNPTLFSLSHQRHHVFTLHDPEDMEVVLPQKLTPAKFAASAVVDLPGIWQRAGEVFRLAAGKPGTPWEKTLLPESAVDARRRAFRWSRHMLAGHSTILVAGTASGYWIVPVLISGGVFIGSGLLIFVGLTQHIGMQSAVADYRLNSRTVYLNPILRFLYWNMNYHIEHHMYPGVPCYNLPELHEQVRYDLPSVPNGLVPAWRVIFASQHRVVATRQ